MSARRKVPSANSEAELIQVCNLHETKIKTYNEAPGTRLEDMDTDPLWQAYSASRDFISAAKPKTMAGLRALARAAKAETQGVENADSVAGSPAEFWAMTLIDALAGGAFGDENPDASLFAMLAEFDELERQFDARYTRGNPAFIEEDKKRDLANRPGARRQDQLAKLIFRTRANTVEGTLAKLRSLWLWNKEIAHSGPNGIMELLTGSACLDAVAMRSGDMS